MASPISQIKPGEYSTNSQLAGDLGKTVVLNGREYRLCKTAAAIATAGGMPVTTAFSAGVPTWVVNINTVLNTADVVGGIPVADTTAMVNYIDSTITVPISAYLLVQYYGPGKVVANTTLVSGGAFGVVSAGSLGAASVDSAVYAPLGIKGHATNTAANSVVSMPLTCIWGA